ncbi:MAG: co-chaperone GroES [Nitrospinae bacterium]|nr:co-chaperone GroES [Nitrospinota bacterium]
MKIKPLADRVIVRPMEEKETKKGAIIIPDSAKERPQEGEVIAVGPGRTDDKGNKITMNVKKGDKVIYGKYAGTEIKLNGEEFLLMREDDILGIIE